MLNKNRIIRMGKKYFFRSDKTLSHSERAPWKKNYSTKHKHQRSCTGILADMLTLTFNLQRLCLIMETACGVEKWILKCTFLDCIEKLL